MTQTLRQLLCCLSLLLSATLCAETSLYGELKTGMDSVHTQTSAGSNASALTTSSTALTDHGSWLGLRGQSALGDTGVKAIWQIEQAVPVGR